MKLSHTAISGVIEIKWFIFIEACAIGPEQLIQLEEVSNLEKKNRLRINKMIPFRMACLILGLTSCPFGATFELKWRELICKMTLI